MDISKLLDWNDGEGVRNVSSLVVSLMVVLLTECFAGPGFVLSFFWFCLAGGLPPQQSTEHLTWIAFRVVALAVALRMVIFGVLKPLERGTGCLARLPEVRFYQDQFPSRTLMQWCQSCATPCGLSVADNAKRASEVWFTFFNEFSPETQKKTFGRGWVCYLFFLVQYSSFLLAHVGLLATVVLYWWTHSVPLAGLVYSVVLLLLAVVCSVANQPSCDNPRGVWREFAEINSVHKEWLRQNTNTVKKRMCEAPSGKPKSRRKKTG